MGSSAEIVVVGPVTQDLTLAISELPDPGASVTAGGMREAVGGKGANPAIACVRLGARTALVGAVGADKVGKRLRKQLAGVGVDVRMVQRRPDYSTGRIVHLVEPDGSRRYIETIGANDDLSIDTARLQPKLGAKTWLLVSTALPCAPLEAAAAAGRAAGATVVLDLAGPPQTNEALLRYGHLARIDAAEATALTGIEVTDFDSAAAVAKWLQVRGPDQVVVQAGAHGDLLRWHTDEVRVPRQPVTTVDPTGAGDAFIATLVVRLRHGDEPSRAARLASAAAAHTAAQLGGTPRFDLADLERLV
jgi:ribokinase